VAESELHGVKKMSYEGKIEFRNVKFAYPTRPENLIFSNLNFTIHPGQNVAFVGASGSGKSTIISLIERFYDVIEGEVLIDDVNIKKYDLKQLRKNIGIVMQEPVMFKRTIKDNILYGRLDATDEEVRQAARDAYIDELLTAAEDKDVPISGGQKQRVAIARAILKNPSILLLDEATSALDSRSEQLVKDSLNKLMDNRTSVLVAHRYVVERMDLFIIIFTKFSNFIYLFFRLLTIMHCNVIFVLEGGVIAEQGTHQELMNIEGRYYNLFTANNN
jgi:ATP-binding cassette subfamily B (MDR/TAP) protein 1